MELPESANHRSTCIIEIEEIACCRVVILHSNSHIGLHRIKVCTSESTWNISNDLITGPKTALLDDGIEAR